MKSNIFKSCLGPHVHEAVYKEPSLDPSDVASAIEYALSSPAHVQVSYTTSEVAMASAGFIAANILDKMLKKVTVAKRDVQFQHLP